MFAKKVNYEDNRKCRGNHVDQSVKYFNGVGVACIRVTIIFHNN